MQAEENDELKSALRAAKRELYAQIDKLACLISSTMMLP
jgi:hypothetical protein